MSLEQKIEQDYIAALKNRETNKVELLRLIKSAVKNEAIKIGGLGTELNDQQIMAVLNREVKQRKDAIEQYISGNRPELAEKEKAELALIEPYLPKGMSDDELKELAQSVISETGATQKSDMGKVMGVLKAKLSNPVDTARAAQFVSQTLQ